nr:M10 family metallopeptidase C-terminal domain-containing protein [Phormidesmis priestleyi]
MHQITQLRQTLQPLLGWHGARVAFLSLFLVALFRVKTVNLAEVATGFAGGAKAASNYKRIQRFLRSFELNYDQIAQLVVRLVGIPKPWVLSVDRTTWELGSVTINILMLGVVHQGVAFPLFWHLLDKRGNSNTQERFDQLVEFLCVFAPEDIDDQWNYKSSSSGWSATSSEGLNLERDFSQDLNEDKAIGDAVTSIESVGNTTLVHDALNNLSVESNSVKHSILLNQKLVKADMFAGWQVLGAETVNGENRLLWKLAATNDLYLWNLDDQWNYKSSSSGWSATSSEGLNLEVNFQVDANGDGTLYEANNAIMGDADANTLDGGIGNDILNGGASNDILIGGAGDDLLIGGAGDDALTGGVGKDQFVFDSLTGGVDTITDFLVGTDKLAVSAIGFGGGLAANAEITEAQFALGTAAMTSSHRFIYDAARGAFSFDSDGSDGCDLHPIHWKKPITFCSIRVLSACKIDQ